MFLLLLCVIFKISTSIIVPTNIDIRCSIEFFIENRINKLCQWSYSNNTLYADTYQSAFEDCPQGFILSIITTLDNFNLKLSNQICNSKLKIWINEESTNYSNVLIFNANGDIALSDEPVENSLGYFLCMNFMQKISTFNQTCSIEEICDKDLNLTCDPLSGKCTCLYSDYWNGSYCVEKLKHSAACLNSNECDDNMGLDCYYGKCDCDNATQLWNGNSCEDLTSVTCSSLNCTCDDTKYFDTRNLLCTFKKNLNERCLSNYECNDNARLFCSINTRTCTKCPLNWNLTNTFCYYHNTNLLNWYESNRWCDNEDAQMLSFNPTQKNFFKSLFQGIKLWTSNSGWFWRCRVLDTNFEVEYTWCRSKFTFVCLKH